MTDTTVTGAPCASPYPKNLNESSLLAAISAGLLEMTAPLVNIRTLIEVMEQDACDLHGANAQWHLEAIKGRAKTIASLGVVLMDELTRATSMHERLSDMVEARDA